MAGPLIGTIMVTVPAGGRGVEKSRKPRNTSASWPARTRATHGKRV